ncbi:YSIRK-type signal peptide-containing protein [Lactobacillus mulieris]|uniref:YSIRK-type signal peptide-containing protein n=1 Tax=Lactobacillus mulieris TaxID=2508708 RepID=UPI0014331ABA|nr:YSIRK-type signal peptide-containing protein [Lactobacillus mulieris]NKC42905.1 YSIRK-type signal peptide-containing protein [Lactobacillus mulieris]
MLSKNNKKQYDLKHANGRQHFSLRKTTLGLASVLLSTTLYLGGNSGQLVHAAEDTNSTTVSSNSDAISTEEAKTTSVDKSALQNAYDNALNVQKSDVKYTNETDSTKKSAYDSAVANAKSVLDNASATSEDVTNAVNELNTAYNSLTGVANTTTTANDTTKTGAGLYSDEDKAKEQASNLTTESSTISRKLSTDFLKKYNVTNGDRYQVDPKDSGVFSSGNIDKWHAAVNTNNKYYNASATGNITITQADYNQNDNTITWTVTFNPNNGVSYSGSGSPAGTGAGGSGSGSFSTATSVYAISISKDLAVQSIKYGWNTLTDATENYNKSQASQSAVAITSSETNNAANEMTVTSGETTAYNSFKKALVSGPLFNYISNGDIGTNITFDPYQNGKTANSKKNSVGFTVQITTSVDTNNLGAFTGLVAGESYITPYLYSQMGDNAFKTPRVLGVYRAANINKGTEGITSEAIPVKVTYNGSETVPSDVTSITYTINKNADNLKKVNASKYANATNDSIQVTTNDWNKGYYDTESVSYPYYYDTNTLKDDLLNSNALSLSNISVNGSSSKIYNTSTSIQNGALVINITAWDQPATGKEITVEKGTTLTPDLVAEKSISNYKQLKAEGYTFSFNNDVDTSKEGTGNYGLLIKYPDYTEANKHNSVQSITVHVTDSNLDNAKKAANDAIDKLNNLNDAQKAIAKAAVKAATTVDAVTAAQTNATTTDTNMGNLSNDDNYKSAESIKQGSNYKNADTDLKKAYDDAVNEAKALLDKSTGTSTGDVSKDPVAVEAAKKKVDEALAALNGDSNLAKAKEEAKKAINQMGDLSDADKEAAKANVDKATEISNVNTAKSDAQDLNDAKKAAKEAIEQMSDLSDADKTAAKSNVDNATNIAGVNTAKQDAQDLNNAKKAAKEAIEQMGNLSDADKTAAKSNVDNATDIAGVNTAKQDAQDLNNAKKAAKEAIEQMSDLSDADKTAAKSNVDNATDIAGVNTAKQDAQDLNNAKKAAKEAIEQMSDLSDADKTAAKSNVDNATDIAGVNTAKQDAQDLNDAKKTAKEAINKLTNLNKAQKEAAIAQVNAAETVAEIQPIVETATALDGKMGDLKKAIEAADAKKSITAYTQASDTKDFDDALTAANTLNSDKGDNEDAAAVQAKIDALTNAKLDGDKQLQDAKDAAIAKINALENLNKAQKEAAIAQVNAAETVAEIQPIVDTATTLDGKMSDLKKAIEAADAKKSTTAYTQASDTTAFDTALDNANTLNSDNGDNEDAEAVQAKIDALTNAKLDGEDQLAKAKSDAIDKINALTNLNKVQKEAAIAQVNAAETKDAIDPIVETATTLDGKMGDLKKAIEAADAKKSTTAYTQASDTKDFDDALTAANTLNSDKGDNEDAEAVQAKIDALTNAKLDGEDQLAKAKSDAIDKINALTNLNKAQKEAAIAQVNAAETKDAIDPIVETATALDGKMSDLKKAIEAADAKKSTTAYTQASDTTAFDTALDNANTLNSDKGDNEDAEAVQAKIDALTNANLDGDKQLQDAKDAAIAKINALENLNKAQKQAAIEAVNNATTVAEIQPIVDTVTTLDGKMGDLKKAIEAADAKKSTTAYTQASDTKDFDDALTAVNTLNSDNGDNEGAEAVQAKIDALNNAKLNGERIALQKAVEVAIAKIEGINPDYIYYNSDSELQSAFKEAVAKGKILLEQRDASDENYQLAREAIEAAMKALNGQLTDKTALQTSVSQSGEVHKSVAYLNASEAAKKAYDDALANAEAVLADKNATQADVDAALAKLNAALQKLYGKESPAKPTVKKNTVKLGTNADRLPQTGSHESVASEVGLGILALGLAALGLVKKRKED